jgi:hypothetical protein
MNRLEHFPSRIEAWDKNVDESLLDLSGYEFTELL